MRISTRGHFPPAFPEFYAPHPCRLPRWKKPIKIKLFGHVCLLKVFIKNQSTKRDSSKQKTERASTTLFKSPYLKSLRQNEMLY